MIKHKISKLYYCEAFFKDYRLHHLLGLIQGNNHLHICFNDVTTFTVLKSQRLTKKNRKEKKCIYIAFRLL